MCKDFLDDIADAVGKIKKMNKPLECFVCDENLANDARKLLEGALTNVVVLKHYPCAERR